MLCSFIARSPFHSETRPFPLFLKPALGSLTVMRTTEDLRILAFGNQYPGIRRSLHSHPTSEEKKNFVSSPDTLCKIQVLVHNPLQSQLQGVGFRPQLPKPTYYGHKSRRKSVGVFFFCCCCFWAGWLVGAKKAGSISLAAGVIQEDLVNPACLLPGTAPASSYQAQLCRFCDLVVTKVGKPVLAAIPTNPYRTITSTQCSTVHLVY